MPAMSLLNLLRENFRSRLESRLCCIPRRNVFCVIEDLMETKISGWRNFAKVFRPITSANPEVQFAKVMGQQELRKVFEFVLTLQLFFKKMLSIRTALISKFLSVVLGARC